MLIFNLFVFFALYFGLKGSHKTCKTRNFVLIASLFLAFFSALRHEGVGNDTYAYFRNFENFSMTWDEVFMTFIPKYLSPGDLGKDPGIDVFNKICSLILPNGRWYIAVISLITISAISLFIFSYSRSLESTLFSYVFYLTMFYDYIPNSAIRQSLAVAFLLLGFVLLRYKKKMLCILLILVASSFHKSSLLGLAFIALQYFQNSKSIMNLGIIAFFVVLIFPNQVGAFLGGSNDVYSEYLVGEYYQKASKPYIVILLISSLFFLSYRIHRLDYFRNENKIYYYGVIFTFILTPLIWVDPSAIRLIAYFGLFVPILIGNEIDKLSDGRKVFFVIMVIFFVKGVIAPSNYHFMWQEMKMHDRYTYSSPANSAPKISQTYCLNNA